MRIAYFFWLILCVSLQFNQNWAKTGWDNHTGNNYTAQPNKPVVPIFHYADTVTQGIDQAVTKTTHIVEIQDNNLQKATAARLENTSVQAMATPKNKAAKSGAGGSLASISNTKKLTPLALLMFLLGLVFMRRKKLASYAPLFEQQNEGPYIEDPEKYERNAKKWKWVMIGMAIAFPVLLFALAFIVFFLSKSSVDYVAYLVTIMLVDYILVGVFAFIWIGLGIWRHRMRKLKKYYQFHPKPQQ